MKPIARRIGRLEAGAGGPGKPYAGKLPRLIADPRKGDDPDAIVAEALRELERERGAPFGLGEAPSMIVHVIVDQSDCHAAH